MDWQRERWLRLGTVAGGDLTTLMRGRPMMEECGMAVRDRLRKDAAKYLEPDEQIQAVFYAKRPSVMYNDRAVVATDRRLLLLELNFFGRATGLEGEAPRDVKLGPASGFVYPITAFDTPVGVSVRFFKDVAEADRAAGF